MRAGQPQAWPLLLHAVFLQLGAYVVRPTAAYRALELDVPASYLGLIAASFAIVPLLVAVFIGRFADAGGDGALLLWGAALMVAAGVGLLLYSDTLLWLLAWNIVLGLGHLMSVLGEQSRVARRAPGKLDSAFGHYTFAGSMGQAIGPLLIVVFGGAASIPNTRLLFGAYLVSALLMAVLAVVMVRTGGAPGAARTGATPSLAAALKVAPPARGQLIGAMAVSMMVLAAVDLISVYLPALGVERGLPAALVGAMLSVRAAATMFSRLGLGLLVARVGRERLIGLSTGASALLVAVLAIPLPVPAMAVLLAAAGVALGIGQPLTMTIISITAPAGTRATWLALRLSANRLGQSAIPAGVGLVATNAGASGVFAAIGAALGLTSLAAWKTTRRPPHPGGGPDAGGRPAGNQ